MEPDIHQLAVQRYFRQVPEECFTMMVPEWLRPTPDHTIAPSLGWQAKGGGKWVKVSNCDGFVEACGSFWNVYAPDGIQKVDLHAVVMPYMPLEEARKFHELITDPDVLPCTWAESVEFSKQKGEPDLGLNNLFNEDDDDASKEDSREGTIGLPGLGVTVRFICVNYSILWDKAEKYCVLQFMADSVDDMLAQLNTCERLLHKPSANLRGTFEDNVEEAKAELIFAMYDNNVNPHDLIQLLYPAMHSDVYTRDCVHCNPMIEYTEKIDSPETMNRLIDALRELGYDENDPPVSVNKGQMRLMAAQGHLEVYTRQMNSMNRFFDAQKLFKLALQPIPAELLSACSQPTLMGVSAMDIDEDDDET